jgi:serine/threonine protein phosphatase PrpC
MKDEKKIVHTANVGDSTGYILVTRLDGKTECITTTTSHNANNMVDYQDTQRAGGLCRFVYTDNEKKSDDWLPVFSGSADCVVREQVPSTARPTNAKGAYGMYVTSPVMTPTDEILQLAVARSIGNFYAPHGYNRVPDQITHEFDKDEKLFVCIASDGLWDVVPDDEQVLQELKKELESRASIQQTMEKYAFVGACLFGPSYCDDISAVVATY